MRDKLTEFIKKNRCTLLGIGPMSLNCVNAVIELAKLHKTFLILIASRRQIDSENLGKGYVNNWSTSEFAKYVNSKDKKGLILGLANERSIAWGIAKACREAGASLAFTYQGEALGKRVGPLAKSLDSEIVLPCDVSDEISVNNVFSEIEKKWGILIKT